MEILVSKEATGHPNDQYYEILTVRDEITIRVRNMGRPEETIWISYSDIIGISIDRELLHDGLQRLVLLIKPVGCRITCNNKIKGDI